MTTPSASTRYLRIRIGTERPSVGEVSSQDADRDVLLAKRIACAIVEVHLIELKIPVLGY